MAKGYRASLDFPKKEVPIDPYLLGVWLGDGTKRNTDITNVDQEIIEYCESIAQNLDLNLLNFLL